MANANFLEFRPQALQPDYPLLLVGHEVGQAGNRKSCIYRCAGGDKPCVKSVGIGLKKCPMGRKTAKTVCLGSAKGGFWRIWVVGFALEAERSEPGFAFRL